MTVSNSKCSSLATSHAIALCVQFPRKKISIRFSVQQWFMTTIQESWKSRQGFLLEWPLNYTHGVSEHAVYGSWFSSLSSEARTDSWRAPAVLLFSGSQGKLDTCWPSVEAILAAFVSMDSNCFLSWLLKRCHARKWVMAYIESRSWPACLLIIAESVKTRS